MTRYAIITEPYKIDLTETEYAIVTPDRRSHRIIARQKGTIIRVTVPYGMDKLTASPIIEQLIEKLQHRLSAKKITYFENQEIACDGGLTFAITRQNLKPDKIITVPRMPRTEIGIGAGLDIGSHHTAIQISSVMCSVARIFAADILLPFAKNTAARCGIEPAGWRIGRGKQTLGTCRADRIITLSPLLVFLPNELREYIICHEIAHLSEMNHSARFHSICDKYCYGREKELTDRLRKFQWQIYR